MHGAVIRLNTVIFLFLHKNMLWVLIRSVSSNNYPLSGAMEFLCSLITNSADPVQTIQSAPSNLRLCCQNSLCRHKWLCNSRWHWNSFPISHPMSSLIFLEEKNKQKKTSTHIRISPTISLNAYYPDKNKTKQAHISHLVGSLRKRSLKHI